MENENLSNIKVDELDSSRKSPIKNILTLLALLFIILVISVVITKLILNDSSEITSYDSNSSLSLPVSELNQTSSANATTDNTMVIPTNNAPKSMATHTSNILERNLTSAIKVPLTSHVPPKKDVKAIKTYSEPKKSAESTKNSTTSQHTITHSTTHITTHTTPKKEYIDKVVTKKEPAHHTTHTSTHTTKSASYLGGKHIKLSHSYYIKVGTYRDSTSIISKIKRNHFNYSTASVDNDKSLTRVLVGPFFSRNQANSQLAKVKHHILTGAYVTKVH